MNNITEIKFADGMKIQEIKTDNDFKKDDDYDFEGYDHYKKWLTDKFLNETLLITRFYEGENGEEDEYITYEEEHLSSKIMYTLDFISEEQANFLEKALNDLSGNLRSCEYHFETKKEERKIQKFGHPMLSLLKSKLQDYSPIIERMLKNVDIELKKVENFAQENGVPFRSEISRIEQDFYPKYDMQDNPYKDVLEFKEFEEILDEFGIGRWNSYYGGWCGWQRSRLC